MKHKTQKNWVTYTLLLFLILFALSSVTLFGLVKYQKQEGRRKDEWIQKNTELLDANRHVLYVASDRIRVGEAIELDKVELREEFCSQNTDLLFGEEDLGKEAITEIEAGTFLNKSMTNQWGIIEEQRKMTYSVLDIPNNIQNGDIVDVRIRYPNGEDFVILSRKQIAIEEESRSRCVFHVEEEELLMMSSALYDYDNYQGTKLYVSSYIEPILQEEREITYLPLVETILQIRQSPNVSYPRTEYETIQERVALESRLSVEDNLAEASFATKSEELPWEAFFLENQ